VLLLSLVVVEGHHFLEHIRALVVLAVVVTVTLTDKMGLQVLPTLVAVEAAAGRTGALLVDLVL
jgi:hypothetical protein